MSNKTVSIRVQYVNPPAAGKKQWTIKDDTGMTFGYYGDKFSFQQGQEVTIEYSTREYKGKEYYSVEAIVGSSPAPEQKAAAQRSTEPQKALPDRSWAPFVSNTVAHAIAAGLIKKPADIMGYALEAKQTFDALDAGTAGKFDDIPQ
jgi:hypothetical protein